MKAIIRILILFIVFTANAQEYDIQWVMGGIPAIVDFRNDTVTNRTIQHPFGTTFTLANICDENGNMRYMTNGIFIGDSTGNDLQGDTGLSPCPYTTEYENDGLNIQQATLFIPMPGNSRYYYLFHYSNDDTVNVGRPATLYYTIIDNEGNGGLGSVIRENVVFCTGHFRGGGMTACKHANGRDYWLIQGEYNTNRFFEFLVTPDTIFGPFIQSIGPKFVGGNDVTYSKFSQDGSKYTTVTYESLVLVMDFDRCSGEFSNPLTIFNNASTQSGVYISGGTAVEFSPNDEFLYVSDNVNLNQYDLWSSDIQDSTQLYLESGNDFSGVDFLQLGPNGKLYCSTWNGGFYFLDVVNDPNDLGDGCDFVFGGQPTLSYISFNLPNIINYELGALAGSACDTLTGVHEIANTASMKLYPNPASNSLNLIYYVDFNGTPEFELFNDLGEVVQQQRLNAAVNMAQFNVVSLNSGVYYWRLSDNDRIIQSGKIAIIAR